MKIDYLNITKKIKKQENKNKNKKSEENYFPPLNEPEFSSKPSPKVAFRT